MTTEQQKRIMQIASSIQTEIEEAKLDSDAVEHIINVFEHAIHDIVLPELHKYKVVHDYVSGYKSIREPIENIVDDFETQLKTLDRIFNCGITFNADWIIHANDITPNWVEKFFATFPWQHIGSTYPEAVQNAFNAIEEARNDAFCNYRKNSMEDLYRERKTENGLKKLQDMQGGNKNIIALPAQLGIRYRNSAPDRVLQLQEAEFGMGTFDATIIILTHPERLGNIRDLCIDTPGDKFKNENNSDTCPYFGFISEKVGYDARPFNTPDESSGSATVFIPSILR